MCAALTVVVVVDVLALDSSLGPPPWLIPSRTSGWEGAADVAMFAARRTVETLIGARCGRAAGDVRFLQNCQVVVGQIHLCCPLLAIVPTISPPPARSRADSPPSSSAE